MTLLIIYILLALDEAGSAKDMQALARRQRLRRAHRLGLTPGDNDHDRVLRDGGRDAVIHYSLPGGSVSAHPSRSR